jgi:hypothetical protein
MQDRIGSSAIAAAFESQYLVERAESDPCGNEGYQPYRTQPGLVNKAKRNNDQTDYRTDDTVSVSHIFVHRSSLMLKYISRCFFFQTNEMLIRFIPFLSSIPVSR